MSITSLQTQGADRTRPLDSDVGLVLYKLRKETGSFNVLKAGYGFS